MILLTDRLVYQKHAAFIVVQILPDFPAYADHWLRVTRWTDVPGDSHQEASFDANGVQHDVVRAYRWRDEWFAMAEPLLVRADADVAMALPNPMDAVERLRRAVWIGEGEVLDRVAAWAESSRERLGSGAREHGPFVPRVDQEPDTSLRDRIVFFFSRVTSVVDLGIVNNGWGDR